MTLATGTTTRMIQSNNTNEDDNKDDNGNDNEDDNKDDNDNGNMNEKEDDNTNENVNGKVTVVGLRSLPDSTPKHGHKPTKRRRISGRDGQLGG